MSAEKPRREIRGAASRLTDSLTCGGPEADMHLARLILADGPEESCAYRAFARALARQLQGWVKTGQPMREDDVVRMLRAAARELVDEARDA